MQICLARWCRFFLLQAEELTLKFGDDESLPSEGQDAIDASVARASLAIQQRQETSYRPSPRVGTFKRSGSGSGGRRVSAGPTTRAARTGGTGTGRISALEQGVRDFRRCSSSRRSLRIPVGLPSGGFYDGAIPVDTDVGCQ